VLDQPVTPLMIAFVKQAVISDGKMVTKTLSVSDAVQGMPCIEFLPLFKVML
jgi:hypothetical protein